MNISIFQDDERYNTSGQAGGAEIIQTPIEILQEIIRSMKLGDMMRSTGVVC